MLPKILLLISGIIYLLFTGIPTFAEETSEEVNTSCPDAKVFSKKLISGIDWDNLYPIRIAGAKLGKGEIPDEAADPKIACACPDNNDVPRIGTQVSMRRPTKLIEVVRVANCSPTLGGTMIQSESRLNGGPEAPEHDSSDVPFYNVNIWAFPITTMLNLFTSVRCNTDYYMDIDLISISTVDPTWNDEELALLFSPEAFIFATPVGLVLQLADAASSAAGKPLNRAIGSAGAWGSLYPFSGYGLTIGSPPQVSSLIATKALAKMHRMGLAKRTMGDDVMCGAKLATTLTKTQYKISMFYPVPEVSGKLSELFDSFSGTDKTLKGSHVIGEPTFLWGEWRNRPGSGEDFLYIIWSWIDCCASREGEMI